MRIVQWAMPYLPVMGGREVFVHRLAVSLSERGHDVTVVAPDFGDARLPSAPEDGAPVRVVRVPLGGLFAQASSSDAQGAAEQAATVLASCPPDVVHAHNIGPDLVILRDAMVRSRTTPPIALTVHGLASTMDPARWSLARYAERAVDAVVAVSEAARAEIAMRVPGLGARLVLVRNGVPIPDDVQPADPQARELLYLGRLSPEKGVAALLVAFSVLVAHDPLWRLVVAGDGPDRPGLVRLAAHLGIADRVEFTGWLTQDEVRGRVRDSLVLAVPSVWDEPFGLVAAEGQAAGRAVLASRTGALPEIVEEGKTGWLVAPGDPLALAGVLRSVADDPSVAVTFGERAAARAAREFGWERCVTAHEELYSRLAEAGPR